MPARERARRRSRAWLALPGAPVVVVAALVGGPVVAVLAGLVVVQAAALWRRGPVLAGTVAGWAGHRAESPRRSTFATLAFGVVPAAIGLAAVTVALDWGIGAVSDRLSGAPSGEVDALDLARATLPRTTDERAESLSYDGVDWADRYFAELAAVPMTYVPFVGPREEPVHGRYINSVAGVRRSYEPGGLADDAPVVWFFGGSTLWGEGQRDDHTIPSAVARLAEAAGRPIRVVNFGERGYTAFQEFLLFEQELARRPHPDLAVFYHGANELYTLLEEPENLGDQPSEFQRSTYRRAFHRAPPLPGQRPPAEPSLVDAYRRTSALDRVLDRLVPAAGADDDAPYHAPPAAVRRALVEADQIYRRSVRLIDHEAAAADVPALVFWQPGPEQAASALDPDPYADLGARVADAEGTIDVSDALVDPPAPVYIDGLHTNELGARLVAEVLWPHLAPVLAEGAP